MEEIKNTKSQIRQPLLIAIAVAIGIFIGSTYLEPKKSSQGLSSNLAKFREVLTSIDKNYVDDVNSDHLTDQAIIEMIEELDPHSRYVSAKEAQAMNSRIMGSYQGIGIQFDILRDTVVVVKPLKGGPSLDAGLLVGDRVISVDGENIAGIGINNEGVFDRLLGESGTNVSVDILRNGERLSYSIQRGNIPQKSVESAYMVDDRIGYIKVVRFGALTHDEFVDAVIELKKNGMERMILDLQSNPGGRMSAAEQITDELIAGEKLVVSQKSKHSRYNSEFYSNRNGLFEDGPIVVLVNEQSASASEIVSGALQDHDRALIVGRRTFGKGLVQLPIELNDESEIMLTIARYYTPSGRSIQKPYEEGEGDSYYQDLSERYNNGEFFSQDSIHFNDSLKFETGKGRVVYGGGGIMPDEFIPFDTSMNSSYYSRLVNSGSIREFVLDYYSKNQESFESMTLPQFLTNWKVSEEMLSRVIEIGKEMEVSFDETQYQQSLPLIKAFIKADIGSLQFDENGFYAVMNPVANEIYVRGIQMFDRAERLAEAEIE